MSRQHKLFLAATVILLLGALFTFPYAYYQILRWTVCLVAGYTAYVSYEKENIKWSIVFGILAILFNPIAPIYMARETWAVIDLTSAFIIVLFIYKHRT